MRTWQKALLLSLAFALALGGASYALYRKSVPTAMAATLDPQQAVWASSFLDLLDGGKFAEAHERLNATAQEKISTDQLAEIWTALPKQLGGPGQRSAPRGEAIAGHPLVTFTLQFPLMSLDARMGFDADGRINGFRIVPAQKPAAPSVLLDSEKFTEREIRLGPDGRELPGTLTTPRDGGPFAAVVLVHGSGPHDRDETIGKTRVFADLAHGLGEAGIAVLRYEKRTHARPQDFAAGNFTVDDETVDDALAAVQFLRSQAAIDKTRIFVVGHSLGAMMAPRIGQRDPQLAGIALLAAPSRKLPEIYIEQIEHLAAADGSISTEETAQIAADKLKAADLAGRIAERPAAENLLGLPSSYWRDLQAYDQVATAAALSMPIFVAQGGRDYQVTMVDFEGWKHELAARDNARFSAYPELSHLFIAGTGTATPDEYLHGEGHFDPRVIADLARWIHSTGVH